METCCLTTRQRSEIIEGLGELTKLGMNSRGSAEMTIVAASVSILCAVLLSIDERLSGLEAIE